MGYNTLIFIVLFNMILICKAWPHKSQEFAQGVSAKSAPAAEDPDDIDIIFPGESNRKNFSAHGKGRNCVETVCEDAEDYPYEYIRKMLQKVPYYNQFFGSREGTLIDHVSRFGEGDMDAKGLCATQTLTKYPKTLVNQAQIEKYIINVDEKKQGVVFETCVPNAHCGEATFPAGYVSKCVQRFSTVRLLAVEEEKDKEPALDSFVIPSCCVCSLVNTKDKNN